MRRGIFAKFYDPIQVRMSVADLCDGEMWLFKNVIFDHWDYWIDGNGTYHGFEFKYEEDAVAFKLVFG
jgi:hypothetical protein